MQDANSTQNGNSSESNDASILRRSIEGRCPGKWGESRLSKKLSYLLRYGAEKEGLTVGDTGYIDLTQLMELPILRFYSEKDVVEEVRTSRSNRGYKRFQYKRECDGKVFVRAIYGRKMERNPYHENSKVYRLLEICLLYICDNVDQFDFQEFPDEYLQSTVVHKLKRQKRLNNTAMKWVLGSAIEDLDLEGVYLTEKSLKIIAERCTGVKHLSLKNCGYLLNDQLFAQMIKKLKTLEKINLAGCTNLTGRTLKSLIKHIPNILGLNISGVCNFTHQDILDFITKSKSLIYFNFLECGIELTDDFVLKLTALWTEKDNMKLVYQFR